MKVLQTEFQNDLIQFLESLPSPEYSNKAYFLEELRPKRKPRVKKPLVSENPDASFIEQEVA